MPRHMGPSLVLPASLAGRKLSLPSARTFSKRCWPSSLVMMRSLRNLVSLKKSA